MDSDAHAMSDVTAYAPIRVIASSIMTMIFGLMMFLVTASIVGLALPRLLAHPEESDPDHGGIPVWLVAGVAIIFGIVSLLNLSSAVGRIVSAFSRACYFRAGPAGLAVRYPIQGWFGRFRLAEFRYRWDEIDDVILYIFRINTIPAGSALHIKLRNGYWLKIDRPYFSLSSRKLQKLLLAIQARAVR
jgi:hypothetical protein